MPKPGWKSLTVHEETVNQWKDVYDLNKELLKKSGVGTFSNFINLIMAGVIEDPKLLIKSIKNGKKIIKQIKTK